MDPNRLHQFVRTVVGGIGGDEREADLVADQLVGANLAGHDSHGVQMLCDYVDGWTRGVLRVGQAPTMLIDRGPIAVLDGNAGFGQVMGHEAMLVASERAREHGVAIVGLRNSFHIGRIGHWGEQLARDGLVAIHFVNVAGHHPLVAPYGGASVRFGTNPFCVAIPGRGDTPALLLDMATSRIAYGKAKVAHNRGLPLPDGCMLDAEGRVTTDPAAMVDGHGGALIAMGDHKGSGLAIVCELVGAALLGGLVTSPESNELHTIINNMLTIAIDPAALGSGSTLVDEAEAFLGYLRTSALRDGFDEVLIPGEPERRARMARATDIPLGDRELAALAATAATAGVPDAAALLRP